MIKVLITGNMGYIGPVVTRHLRSVWPSAQLAGVDMAYFAQCLTGRQVDPHQVVDVQHYSDVRDLTETYLAGYDAVVHLAAISNDPMGKAFEDVTMQINYQGTIDVAHAAKRAGVRSFVFASSCSVYGTAGESSRGEDSPLDPLTAYAKSKVRAEQGLASLAGPAFTITCLRFSTACGMSPRLRLDLVLNDFVASAVSSGRIEVLSDGSPWRPFIDVNDMARAVEWSICRPQSEGGPYLTVNVGADLANYQIRQLAAAVRAALPHTHVWINPEGEPDHRTYRVDFGLYRRLAPNHQPTVSIPATIRRLRDELQAMNFTDANFRQSSLMRLNVLRSLVDNHSLDQELRWLPPAHL